MNALRDLSLKGKKALITGAARGLGKIFAETLAASGADVCIADIDAKEGRNVALELDFKSRSRVIFVEADVTKQEDLRVMMDYVLQEFGDLDICVANAAVFAFEQAADISMEQWNYVMNVNLTGNFFTCQAAGKHMIKQGKGSIVLVTSISAHRIIPFPGGAYAVSKSGLITMAKGLAFEWGRYGVRVNALSPSTVDVVTQDKEHQQLFSRNNGEKTPVNSQSQIDELRSALIYLASDASSYTTGSEVIVDGSYMVY